ncbi:hypothetical protein [Streptomyces sp. NPDC004685]
MRIRTAATTAGGTLALLTVLAPAAQADSHKSDTTFTSVTFSKTTVNRAAVSPPQMGRRL